MRKNSQKYLPKIMFLCIITTSIVTALSLSKYQSTVTGSTNSARVSRPILNVSIEENQQESLVIDCNTEKTSVNYKINVSNKEKDTISEVSLKYDIIITLPEAAPNGLTLKLDDKELNANQKQYTIENAGEFSPSSDNENTHILTFVADPEVVRNCSMQEIKITVYAEQID